MITILNFDKTGKNELLKEYLGKTRTIKLISTQDTEEALKVIKKKNPDIILLGGDVDNGDKSLILAGRMMSDKGIAPKTYKNILITTWDSEEAYLLRRLLKDTLYCPFSETLANILKQKVKNKKTYKSIKKKKE